MKIVNIEKPSNMCPMESLLIGDAFIYNGAPGYIFFISSVKIKPTFRMTAFALREDDTIGTDEFTDPKQKVEKVEVVKIEYIKV